MVAIKQNEIDSFKKNLSPGARVFVPGDDGYERSLERWSETAVRRAQMVVQCASAQDVSLTLKFVTANKINMAVKGGGHSCSGGSSSSGIVVDLTQLNQVKVDPERKLVYAGGGATWRDVDGALAKHKLATVGGTVNHTGIGGLTLGGGYGWLTGFYGLVIDVLEEVEMITADGKIIKASKTENPEIFWGIRGYGKCLGAVTEFVYRAFDQPNEVFSGQLIFPGSDLEKVIAAAEKFHSIMNERSAAIIAFARPPPANFAPSLVVVPFYNGDEAEAKRLFASFLDARPVMEQLGMVPYETINGTLNHIATFGDRKRFSPANLRQLKYPTLKRAFEKYTSMTDKYPEAMQSAVLIEMYHPKVNIEHARDEAAFPWRDDLMNAVVLPRWKSKELDKEIANWSHEISRILLEDGNSNRVYVNFSEGLEDISKEIGENKERLLRLKAELDPTNVFGSLQGAKFAT
ncbi:uncharacterized protein VTP21DRAFT_4908 [Calcarisporiella thermophila]|uniref:uncharacterized protein n=1 Tax=Calcarisporiella thermophila TaxID=911321 RepID=UPI0037439378